MERVRLQKRMEEDWVLTDEERQKINDRLQADNNRRERCVCITSIVMISPFSSKNEWTFFFWTIHLSHLIHSHLSTSATEVNGNEQALVQPVSAVGQSQDGRGKPWIDDDADAATDGDTNKIHGTESYDRDIDGERSKQREDYLSTGQKRIARIRFWMSIKILGQNR